MVKDGSWDSKVRIARPRGPAVLAPLEMSVKFGALIERTFARRVGLPGRGARVIPECKKKYFWEIKFCTQSWKSLWKASEIFL